MDWTQMTKFLTNKPRLFAALMLEADGAESPAAAVVFAFAALTDFLDGELSRRLHVGIGRRHRWVGILVRGRCR